MLTKRMIQWRSALPILLGLAGLVGLGLAGGFLAGAAIAGGGYAYYRAPYYYPPTPYYYPPQAGPSPSYCPNCGCRVR